MDFFSPKGGIEGSLSLTWGDIYFWISQPTEGR